MVGDHLTRQRSAYLDQPKQLWALSDPSRVAIVCLLMAKPATLTQLGTKLGRHPAWVRYHLKQLETAGLVELAEVRTTRNYTERFYRATAPMFSVNMMLLPDAGERGLIVIVGSDDLGLDLLAAEVRADATAPDVLTLPMGSLEGLITLHQGQGNLAGCHLRDPETGEFNLPYARRLFPGRSLTLVTLAHREQGLLVAPGNPLHITSIAAAASQGATLVNRNAGSGTRLLLDRLVAEAGLPAQALRGYFNEVLTHSDVARCVRDGVADVGLGIQAAAVRYGLDFVPLEEERYDLLIPDEEYDSRLLAPLLSHLQGATFRHTLSALPGYSARHLGVTHEFAA